MTPDTRFESGWKKNDPGCRIAKCSQKMTKSPEIPSKFSGRLRRPGKIGYFGVANLDFTREIVHLRVSKPQNFPAAEGGRKNRYFGTPKSSFSGGKTLRNRSQTEPVCPKSVSSRKPPLVFGRFFRQGGGFLGVIRLMDWIFKVSPAQKRRFEVPKKS